MSSMARDDVTYVVLDDRGEGRKVFEQEQAGVEKQERGRAADSSSTKRGGKSQDQSQDKGGKANANEKGPSSGNGNGDGGNDGDDPEIEILENDPNLYAPVETDTKSNESVNAQSSRTRTRRRPRQYQTLAVRPAASVLPLLTNLLSPFVMGISKSARAVSGAWGLGCGFSLASGNHHWNLASSSERRGSKRGEGEVEDELRAG